LGGFEFFEFLEFFEFFEFWGDRSAPGGAPSLGVVAINISKTPEDRGIKTGSMEINAEKDKR